MRAFDEFNLIDLWRRQRENYLDTDAERDFSYSYRLGRALATLDGDDCSLERLETFLVPFFDLTKNLHNISGLEFWRIEGFSLLQIEGYEFLLHILEVNRRPQRGRTADG